MNVAALIVTYSDRYNFCVKVINSCLSQNVFKIILVSNDSAVQSLEKYKKLALQDSRIELKIFNENKGSAGGYAEALKIAYSCSDIHYYWLLDDDNMPLENALNSLIVSKQLLDFQNEGDFVLYSYRGLTSISDKIAVSNGKKKEYGFNSFAGYSLYSSLRKFSKTENKFIVNYPLTRIMIGPYGGMFISRDIVGKVGFPKVELFLYADDLEYTDRFDHFGINQYLVYASKIKDIDVSWTNGNSFFSPHYSDVKLYYGLRNHAFMSRKFISSRVIYNLNKISFFILVGFYFMKNYTSKPSFTLKRMKLIIKALIDSKEFN